MNKWFCSFFLRSCAPALATPAATPPQSQCHLSEIPPVTVFIVPFCFTEIHFSTAVFPLNSWIVGSVCLLSLTLIQPFYLAH